MTQLEIHFTTGTLPLTQDPQLLTTLQHARGLSVFELTMDAASTAYIADGRPSGILGLLEELVHVQKTIVERGLSLFYGLEHSRILELVAKSELKDKAWAATGGDAEAPRQSIDVEDEAVKAEVAGRVEKMKLEIKLWRAEKKEKATKKLSEMKARAEDLALFAMTEP